MMFKFAQVSNGIQLHMVQLCRGSQCLDWSQSLYFFLGTDNNKPFLRGSSQPFSSGNCDYKHVHQLKMGWKGEDRSGVFLKLSRKFMFEENRDGIKLFCLIILILELILLARLQYEKNNENGEKKTVDIFSGK